MIIYMIYMIIAFAISNGKLLSPSVIFSASFTFMISLAYIFKDILGFEVSKLTFTIFIIAGVLFLFTELSVQMFYSIKYRNRNVIKKERTPLVINKQMQQMMIFILLISLILAVIALIINTNTGALGVRMSQYKTLLLYNANLVKYRFYIAQLYKINTAIAYLCAYIFIYNFAICKIKIKYQINYIIVIVLFCAFSMFAQAARQPVIEIILFLPIVYISLMMRHQDKKKIWLLIKKAIPILGIAVVVFYYTSTLVGRRKTQRGILEYLAVYVCGGLYSFNLHVNEPARNAYWGQSSFADIYNFLIKLGVVSSEVNMQYHEFDLYGNTVTMFGRWYEDFGQIGVYIMTILVAFFFSTFFYKKVTPIVNGIKEHHLGRLIYCKFAISLVWAGYDDRIRALLSVQTVIFVIVTIFLWNFCVKRSYRFRWRKK